MKIILTDTPGSGGGVFNARHHPGDSQSPIEVVNLGYNTQPGGPRSLVRDRRLREIRDVVAQRYPDATVVDRTPEGYDALMTRCDDLADSLKHAVRRIQIANAENDSVLSAWLSDAIATLAAAGRPVQPITARDRLTTILMSDRLLSDRWWGMACRTVQGGLSAGIDAHDWATAANDLAKEIQRLINLSPQPSSPSGASRSGSSANRSRLKQRRRRQLDC